MITPTAVTDFNRSNPALEEFLLFGIAVAGKDSDQTAEALERFLSRRPAKETFPPQYTQSPFAYIRTLDGAGLLRSELEHARLSPYGQRERSFRAVAYSGLNLRTCTADDLQAIPGIGPKTARFFLIHTRPDGGGAALDTHILRWMRDMTGDQSIPKATPPVSTYGKWEKLFLDLVAASMPGMNLGEADLLIWTAYSGRGK